MAELLGGRLVAGRRRRRPRAAAAQRRRGDGHRLGRPDPRRSTSWTRTGSTPSPPGSPPPTPWWPSPGAACASSPATSCRASIAHEFSHILNGDMRLNIRLMGLVHGILLIALIGSRIILRPRSAGPRAAPGHAAAAAPLILIAVAMMVIGYIGVFFANLIKAAVSRSREFLADASAVQFTRNPSGIAGALKKIGGLERRLGDRQRARGRDEPLLLRRGDRELPLLGLLHPPAARGAGQAAGAGLPRHLPRDPGRLPGARSTRRPRSWPPASPGAPPSGGRRGSCRGRSSPAWGR